MQEPLTPMGGKTSAEKSKYFREFNLGKEAGLTLKTHIYQNNVSVFTEKPG